MKLLTAKKRKIAILFNGGLGDILLFVPLLKELKKHEFHITCIYYGKFKNDCLLDKSLFDEKKFIGSKPGLLIFSLKKFKHFINFYINHLGKGKVISLAAVLCSSRITKTGDAKSKNSRLYRNIPVEPGLSDAEQNLRLLYTPANAKINSIQSFYFSHPVIDQGLIANYTDKTRPEYYVIQVSAGNNTTPFKNWPIKNWITLVTKLSDAFKNISFLIVGDEFETSYITAFENIKRFNCKVLIGKTSIPEVFNLIAYSKGYIGLDSGIMHMAVALQKKTVTIFGGSNEKLYAYSVLDKTNHRVITASISCRPCSAWKNANTSRVSNPMLCPDFACLTGINEAYVYKEIINHFNLGGDYIPG